MTRRTYNKAYEAWYADTIAREPEIWFGVDGGELHGEMTMKWVELNGPTPCLECFSDGFPALAAMPDVLGSLAELEGSNFTPDEFAEILERCGFQDVTPYEWPMDRIIEAKITALKREAADLRAKLGGDE